MKNYLLVIGIFICQSVLANVDTLKSAKWMTVDFEKERSAVECPVFQKAFILNNLKQFGRKGTKLYITALGVYVARINGKRIGEDYFTPGFTNYHERLQYQIYDISNLLKKGKNILEVMVGKGWYSGKFRNLKADYIDRNFGSEIGLLCEIRDANKNLLVKSDESWIYSESKVKSSGFYEGEMQDRNYVVKDWKLVRILNHSKDILVPVEAEPVRKQEVFRRVRAFKTAKNEQVIDFGQNMAGWVRFKVKGKKGDTVRLYHAEVLDSLGNFYTENLRNAKSVDIYVLSGKRETLEPHFTYHGFRYVKVEGMKLEDGDFKAVALYSDLRKTGSFNCSDEMLNKLQNNIEWSMKSNFVDIPTDCPQRSERLAWTGDAQIFCPTASYLFNTKSFYRKWLTDVALEQRPNGVVPNFVPTSSPLDIPLNGVAGWGDAATIIPWTLFQVYGDTGMLGEHFPMMKRWVDYINSVSQNGLWVDRGYGDWYAMGDSTSISFINQCYFAHSAELVARAARVLGKPAIADQYTQVSRKAKRVFEVQFGRMDTKATSTQTALALVLDFGLLPEEQLRTAADRLATLVRANGNKLTTGFLGTPLLLKALSDNGHLDLAYGLLMQSECPSWLYPITRGATTIWERWDAIRPDGSLQPVSFNHYAYGEVGRWMYENIAGITPTAPGYAKVMIRPLPGGGLTWAKGSYLSSFGKIGSSWKLKNGNFSLVVEIPEGVTAEVWMPGGKFPTVVREGKYKFKKHI